MVAGLSIILYGDQPSMGVRENLLVSGTLGGLFFEIEAPYFQHSCWCLFLNPPTRTHCFKKIGLRSPVL